MSVDFFHFLPHNMSGNIELNVDTTNNHPALTSYFANPFFKKNSPFRNPRLLGNADDVSIVTTMCVSNQRTLQTSVNSFTVNAEHIVWFPLFQYIVARCLPNLVYSAFDTITKHASSCDLMTLSMTAPDNGQIK